MRDVLRQLTVQAAPFSLNAVGLLFVPVCEPLKPMYALAPAARLPFHDSFAAVTFAPD